MPNWKKVLVSGSNAHLNQVTSSGGITTDGDLTVGGDSTVAGDLLVTQHIKHKGDTNTLINFTSSLVKSNFFSSTITFVFSFFITWSDNPAIFYLLIMNKSKLFHYY